MKFRPHCILLAAMPLVAAEPEPALLPAGKGGIAWNAINPTVNREFLTWQNAQAIRAHYRDAIAAASDDASKRAAVTACLVASHARLQETMITRYWDGARTGAKNDAASSREIISGQIKAQRIELAGLIGPAGLARFEAAEITAAIAREIDGFDSRLAEQTDGLPPLDAETRAGLARLFRANLVGKDGKLPADQTAGIRALRDGAKELLTPEAFAVFERRWSDKSWPLAVQVPLVTAPGMESSMSLAFCTP